ncbi:CLUMA_CG003755, isoform A [Clunio marinus]|uniref:CLUMA_CG003755, isoform A n=1 Tax=Clunio marinus TaxID=568069 RepID=A0A1J1HU56_9DIPT|nr:CLUMA_CG003755, isoform A [Clunio marinus]
MYGIMLKNSSSFNALSRLTINKNKFKTLPPLLTTRNYSASEAKGTSKDNRDNPVKFIGSEAHSWDAKFTRSSPDIEQIPIIQPISVVLSVGIFLLYFCVLREENDIDLEFEQTLYQRVPGMEETQLIINYKYNIENQIDNTEIIARMRELGMKPENIEV